MSWGAKIGTKNRVRERKKRRYKVLVTKLTVLIKGAGELASGVAHRLSQCHFKVCMTEIPQPKAVRRGVAFCEAVHEGEKEVEGVVAKLVSSPDEILLVWQEDKIPLLVDPETKVKDINNHTLWFMSYSLS